MAFGNTLKDALRSALSVSPGQVFWADDRQVSQNIKVALKLTAHHRRPVVIMQAVPNQPGNTSIVLVCPMTSGRPQTRMDVLKPPGEAGLEEASIIQVSLLFPIPKAALLKQCGELSGATHDLLKVRIAQVLGIVSAPNATVREAAG